MTDWMECLNFRRSREQLLSDCGMDVGFLVYLVLWYVIVYVLFQHTPRLRIIIDSVSYYIFI